MGSPTQRLTNESDPIFDLLWSGIEDVRDTNTGGGVLSLVGLSSLLIGLIAVIGSVLTALVLVAVAWAPMVPFVLDSSSDH